MSKFGVCLGLLWLGACGGSKAPADAPKTVDDAVGAAGESGAKPNAREVSEKPSAKPEQASAKPVDDSPKATRSAQDLLTAPDVVFMFSFNASDIKQTAESKCTASSSNDPKKMNQCMAKARTGLEVDGYRFKQTGGKWYWLTLRTQGKILRTLHKFEVDFSPETAGSVVLKPKGKDLGSAPGLTPSSVTFSVPNAYQIVVNDPKLGALVYEAKIGSATD